jgi:hypothetical protein
LLRNGINGQTLLGFEEEDFNMDQTINQNEMGMSTLVPSINQSYNPHNFYQPPLYYPPMSNPTLPFQTNQYSSFAMDPINQPRSDTTSNQHFVYWQYPTTNTYS